MRGLTIRRRPFRRHRLRPPSSPHPGRAPRTVLDWSPAVHAPSILERHIPAVVGLQALSLRPQGSGVQTYARELTRALRAATDVALVARVQADAVGQLPPGVQARPAPVASGVRRALLGLWPVRGVDLLHSLDVDLPLRQPGPMVTTVHDTSVFDVPWAHSRLRATGEQLLLRASLRRADAVLAVSAFTAERVQALFGREAVVTPLAAGPQFVPPSPEALAGVRARYDLPERWVLHVGNVEPRKDVPMLATACRRLEVPLLLAGRLLESDGPPAGVRHLGYVPEDDLPALYAAASAVGYVSRYEGFGLPPLEALSCGAIVVATRVGALPETLGGAAVLVPPQDEDALVDGLRQALDDRDLAQELRAAALVRAGRLTWLATAEATLAVYRSLGISC
jgi:glycosyltransferase involved in cell wall biosynthesis